MNNPNHQSLGNAIFDMRDPVTEAGNLFIQEFGEAKNTYCSKAWDDFIVAVHSLDSGDINYIIACIQRSQHLKIGIKLDKEGGYIRISWSSIILFIAPMVGYKTFTEKIVEKKEDWIKKSKKVLTKALHIR